MIRWLFGFALTSLAACAPDPICDMRVESCMFLNDEERFTPYWPTPPETLEPGESVVEVIPAGGFVEVPRKKFYGEPDDEPRQACIVIRPVAVFHFRVTRTLAGDFRGSDFSIEREGGSCSSDNVVGIDTFVPPTMDQPLYMVIRLASPTADVSTRFGNAPVMTYRQTSLPLPPPQRSPLESPPP